MRGCWLGHVQLRTMAWRVTSAVAPLGCRQPLFGPTKAAICAPASDAMARLLAPAAVMLAALLLAGANAIIVGRVYRPVVATPFGAMPVLCARSHCSPLYAARSQLLPQSAG